jgi:SHS2 domain-containing protein
MVKWLNEVLYFFEVKEFLGKEFKILTLDENHLHAEITGETYKREKHLIKTEIKAVTYHQLALKQQKGKWKTKIIFDL